MWPTGCLGGVGFGAESFNTLASTLSSALFDLTRKTPLSELFVRLNVLPGNSTSAGLLTVVTTSSPTATTGGVAFSGSQNELLAPLPGDLVFRDFFKLADFLIGVD